MAPRERTLTKQIIVRIEPDLDEWLTELAKDDGRTKAQTVRWILRNLKDDERVRWA